MRDRYFQDYIISVVKSLSFVIVIFCGSLFIFIQSIAEFDLRTVRYEVKSPQCHELSLVTPPHDRITFNFRCEQEAQEWATVVMSSLREAHRGLPSFYFLPTVYCQCCSFIHFLSFYIMTLTFTVASVLLNHFVSCSLF